MAHAGKILAIVNPIAGAGSAAKLWPSIQSYLTKLGLTFDSVFTKAPGHAITLTSDAISAGCTMILSVGGDGTLNEVANGLLRMDAAQREAVTIAVIPVGTGADFARTLGLPRTWREACDHLLIEGTRVIDAGAMTYLGRNGEEQRYFVNVAGLGFDGEVTSRTNEGSKMLGGTLPYVTNLVLTLVTYVNKDVDVTMDENTLPGRMNSIVVANGGFFGGGMWIAPDAVPDDGFFDVVTIGDVGKLELLQTMPLVYKGTHVTHPKVKVTRAKEVSVVSQQDMWLQADGESLGRAPVTFHMLPHALRLKI